MSTSHGGMQRSLEMMKQMARNGGKLERDPVEDRLPFVVGGLVVAVVAIVLLLNAASWLVSLF